MSKPGEISKVDEKLVRFPKPRENLVKFPKPGENLVKNLEIWWKPGQISKTWWMFRWSSGKFLDLRDFLTPGVNLVKFRNLGKHDNNFEKNVFFGFGEKRFLQSGPKMVWSKRVFVLRTEPLSNSTTGIVKKYVANYFCTCWSRAQK